MKLTKNFNKSEFDSKDGADMPDEVLFNVQRLANQMQQLRTHLNKPVNINSGYRSISHNEAIGGSLNSQHILGKACDITVQGMTPKEVAEVIEDLILCGDMLQGGIGIYRTFVHYDIRGFKKVRW
jgi:uncharacterized protein YcbK (DUF882 family)